MEEEIPTTLIAKDPKKVEQGNRLAQISKKAKQDKARQRFIESDDEELKNHFMHKLSRENFSYVPYILYPLAGISTLGFLYILLFANKVVSETPIETPKKKHKSDKNSSKNKYETLG